MAHDGRDEGSSGQREWRRQRRQAALEGRQKYQQAKPFAAFSPPNDACTAEDATTDACSTTSGAADTA
jgi:hypothetical protein